MSCGHPHDDCASVLQHVYEYIDHEMADDDLATVKEHLDDCTPCLAEYGLEQAVKSLVHRRCSARSGRRRWASRPTRAARRRTTPRTRRRGRSRPPRCPESSQ